MDTCSGGLFMDDGTTEILATGPDPARMSFRMLLTFKRRRLSAATAEPLAQVDNNRIKP
jgi:hypothetical protein